MGLCTRNVVFAGLGALVSGVHCSTDCTLIACIGGFEWTAKPEDGDPIAQGEYVLEVVVEGVAHEIVCTVAAEHGASACTPETDGDVTVLVEREGADGASTAIRVMVADYSDTTDSDESQSVRGPEEIAITLQLGERTLVDASFEPTYERDENFWGDERCGYCDLRVTEASTWMR